MESSCPKCGAPIAADAPHGLCPKCVLGAAAADSAATRSPSGRVAPPTVEEVAAHFPELEILELIGAGGMGAVYKVRQPKLDRFVALKILSSDLAEKPTFAERFNREGRFLARLNHPHIVSVFDFGSQGPFLYLLLEYVDGVNLREAMQEGNFTSSDCLTLVQDICAALKYAHDEGILHRDIKPENVLLDSRGRVKIADFGLAKLVGRDGGEDVTLTRQGAAMGTPHYMAPEQLDTPQDVDQRADIYSLGVVFYELLTGELPIGRFDPPSGKSPLDPRVDKVVLRALERKRERRYQDVGEVKTDIDAITQSKNWESAERGAPASFTAAKASSSTPKKSRSATLAAILAGGSLLLGVAVVFVLIAVYSLVAPQEDYKEVLLWTLAGAGLLIVCMTALLGVFFGVKALGEVRQSGDRKSDHIVGAKVSGSSPETARLANASAIVTGISLLLGVVVMFVLIAANSLVPRQEDYRDLLMWMLTGVGLLITSATALLGVFFGVKALIEIRRSGGRKVGFGTALFGVLGWLALIPIAAVGMLIFNLVS